MPWPRLHPYCWSGCEHPSLCRHRVVMSGWGGTGHYLFSFEKWSCSVSMGRSVPSLQPVLGWGCIFHEEDSRELNASSFCKWTEWGLPPEAVGDGEEDVLKLVWGAHPWVFLLCGFLICLLVALAVSSCPSKEGKSALVLTKAELFFSVEPVLYEETQTNLSLTNGQKL